MLENETYIFDKVTGGDAKVYAVLDGEQSNELISRLVSYTLNINGTSYSSLAEPMVSTNSLEVGDSIVIYTDDTGASKAYFSNKTIYKNKTTYTVTNKTISSITVNGDSVNSLIESSIVDSDVVAITAA